MITIMIALIIGIIVLTAAVLYQGTRGKKRSRTLNSLQLRPNCLLTRLPLVFVGGRASIFRLNDHWNSIPRFLREHGYEVMILEPVALIGHPAGSAASLMAALSDLPDRVHLIADTSSRAELEAIANRKHPKVASLNIIENPERVNIPSLSYRSKTDALKPLANALEVFEIHLPNGESPKFGWAFVMDYLLLSLHNILALLRGHGTVDALEVGEFQYAKPWLIENQYLDLAIEIAERDFAWGRQPSTRESFSGRTPISFKDALP